MTKISIVIPHVPNLPGTNEALLECLFSLKDYKQILVVANEGTGYGKNVNEGLRMATGDFLVVMNNDLTLLSGSLNDMVSNDREFVVPMIAPEPRDFLPRSVFGFNRAVYEEIVEKYGYFFDESFRYYFEDDDLHMRMQELGIKSVLRSSVIFHHKDGGGLTCKQFGEQEGFDRSKKIFQEKWATRL